MPYVLISLTDGGFVMRSDHHYPEERSAHLKTAGGFEIGATAVTNRHFEAFVAESKQKSNAEILPEHDGKSDMPPENFVAGSLVFQMTNGPMDLRDFRNWWRFVTGACWHAP